MLSLLILDFHDGMLVKSNGYSENMRRRVFVDDFLDIFLYAYVPT